MIARTEDEATLTSAAAQYFQEHPRSPAAVRQPKIMRRGHTFIALLGSTLDDGIAGMGESVHSALEVFDCEYRSSLRPPRSL